jgi:hypothetical protein
VHLDRSHPWKGALVSSAAVIVVLLTTTGTIRLLLLIAIASVALESHLNQRAHRSRERSRSRPRGRPIDPHRLVHRLPRSGLQHSSRR